MFDPLGVAGIIKESCLDSGIEGSLFILLRGVLALQLT